MYEFAALFDLNHWTAERKLAALAKAGKATATRKRVTASDGRLIHYKAYRLV